MYWKLWFVLIRTQILRQVIYYLMGDVYKRQMVNSFITDNHISKENIEKMKGKNINLLIG